MVHDEVRSNLALSEGYTCIPNPLHAAYFRGFTQWTMKLHVMYILFVFTSDYHGHVDDSNPLHPTLSGNGDNTAL